MPLIILDIDQMVLLDYVFTVHVGRHPNYLFKDNQFFFYCFLHSEFPFLVSCFEERVCVS